VRFPHAWKAAARSRRQNLGQTEQSVYDGREWLGTVTRLRLGFRASDAIGKALGTFHSAEKAAAAILKIRRGSSTEEDAT
jgi:hypothetical protein